MIEIRGDNPNGSSKPKSLTPHIRFKSGWKATIDKEIVQFDVKKFRKIEIHIYEKEAKFFNKKLFWNGRFQSAL